MGGNLFGGTGFLPRGGGGGGPGASPPFGQGGFFFPRFGAPRGLGLGLCGPGLPGGLFYGGGGGPRLAKKKKRRGPPRKQDGRRDDVGKKTLPFRFLFSGVFSFLPRGARRRRAAFFYHFAGPPRAEKSPLFFFFFCPTPFFGGGGGGGGPRTGGGGGGLLRLFSSHRGGGWGPRPTGLISGASGLAGMGGAPASGGNFFCRGGGCRGRNTPGVAFTPQGGRGPFFFPPLAHPPGGARGRDFGKGAPWQKPVLAGDAEAWFGSFLNGGGEKKKHKPKGGPFWGENPFGAKPPGNPGPASFGGKGTR